MDGGTGLNDVVDAAAGGCDAVVGQQASGRATEEDDGGGKGAVGWSSLSGRKPSMKNRPMQAPAGLVTSSAE